MGRSPRGGLRSYHFSRCPRTTKTGQRTEPETLPMSILPWPGFPAPPISPSPLLLAMSNPALGTSMRSRSSFTVALCEVFGSSRGELGLPGTVGGQQDPGREDAHRLGPFDKGPPASTLILAKGPGAKQRSLPALSYSPGVCVVQGGRGSSSSRQPPATNSIIPATASATISTMRITASNRDSNVDPTRRRRETTTMVVRKAVERLR